MKIRKLVLATVGATVLLGSLVSASASARSFSVDNQSIRAAFSNVRFVEPRGVAVDCHVTLEGSLHSRTIAKTLGTLIGYITRATLGPCETGASTILTETLPWNIRYSGFEGILPEIRSVILHVVNASFKVRFPPTGPTCLARSEANEPVIGRLHFDAAPSNHVRLGFEGRIRTGIECLGVRGELLSETTSPYVVLLGTSTPISVTLI
jgi:hypothetical protein